MPRKATILLIILACSFTTLFHFIMLNNFRGNINLQIIDALSEEPLEGVMIKVFDSNVSATTNSSGLAYLKGIKLRIDKHSKYIQTPYGIISVFAFKDGYYSSAVFYVQVYKNYTRDKVTISLFPYDGILPGSVISIVEAPNQKVADEIFYSMFFK